ncbi:MAG: acyl-CoA dehydrogenase, partial [Bdellovibrionia bacterium]
LSEYSLKKISRATGIKQNKGSFDKLHPSVLPQREIFEKGVRTLAKAADRILRKHGKAIIGKQFATKRLADIMTDLFVLAAVLSRVSTSVQENGEANAAKELEILQAFASQVLRRTKDNFAQIDENDDELIKSLANHALENEKYIWDNV